MTAQMRRVIKGVGDRSGPAVCNAGFGQLREYPQHQSAQVWHIMVGPVGIIERSPAEHHTGAIGGRAIIQNQPRGIDNTFAIGKGAADQIWRELFGGNDGRAQRHDPAMKVWQLRAGVAVGRHQNLPR